MATPRLGRVQLRIMKVLWEKGRATAREITDALAKKEHSAHSTVQTLLRKLEAKGTAGHDVLDRTFIFYPLVTEETITRSATRELVTRLFDDSPAGLVAHLVKNERLSRKELDQIRKLIEEERKR